MHYTDLETTHGGQISRACYWEEENRCMVTATALTPTKGATALRPERQPYIAIGLG